MKLDVKLTVVVVVVAVVVVVVVVGGKVLFVVDENLGGFFATCFLVVAWDWNEGCIGTTSTGIGDGEPMSWGDPESII